MTYKNGDIITLGSSNISFSHVKKESGDDFDEEMNRIMGLLK